MSRIAPASPPYPPAIQSRLDVLMPPGVPPLVLFRVLARDERLFERTVGGGLLDRGHLTLREREIVILRVCANHGSEYEWGVHVVAFSTKAKFSEEHIRGTLQGNLEEPIWSHRERLILRLCDVLSETTDLDDVLWAELSDEFSPEALIELLLLNGFYRTISVLTNTLRLEPEAWAARFPLESA